MDAPHNIEAEKALLGILLNHNEAFYEINLVQGDFYEPGHGELFILIADQITVGRQVTAMTLQHDAQDADIGGIRSGAYLRQLEDAAPPHALVKGFAHAIQQTALRRRLIDVGASIQQQAVAAPVSVTSEELRLRVEESMAGLFRSVADSGLRQIGEVGDAMLEVMKKQGSTSTGIPIGLKAVQELTGALLPGRLYMLAGSPGSGKTGLAQQIAEFAGGNGFVSAIFSAEMSAEELASRAMTAETGIGSDKIERNLLADNQQFEQLWLSNERLKKLPIYIDASARPTVAMVRARAARKKKMGGLDLVVVDHLHYLRPASPKMNQYEAHDDNLMELKALAKDLQVPVLCICQLGSEGLRELAKWPFPKPNQSQLLFGAAIDRSADVVAILYREEYFLKRNPPPVDAHYRPAYDARLLASKNLAHIILTKRKGGDDSGTREMSFDAPRVRFVDGTLKALYKADELNLVA